MLVPLTYHQEAGALSDWRLLLIKRSATVSQAGDLSCPGGMLDRKDALLRPLVASRHLPFLSPPGAAVCRATWGERLQAHHALSDDRPEGVLGGNTPESLSGRFSGPLTEPQSRSIHQGDLPRCRFRKKPRPTHPESRGGKDPGDSPRTLFRFGALCNAYDRNGESLRQQNMRGNVVPLFYPARPVRTGGYPVGSNLQHRHDVSSDRLRLHPAGADPGSREEKAQDGLPERFRPEQPAGSVNVS